MTRLVLLRHGVTTWNAEGRWQGHTDVPLAQEGLSQAARVAASMAALPPDVIWSSDLGRARQTAAPVEALTGLTAVIDERLREIHVGSFAGRDRPSVFAEHGHGPWDYSQYGGESDVQVTERLAPALAEIVAALEAVGERATGLLVSHGHTIRLATLHLLGWPIDAVHDLGPMANCGWVELERHEPTGRWRLIGYNRVAPIS
ncbi:histidine phosphatase family protein [Nocardioides sp. Kera G14]|uniref:histidine phosphatase family protein n=1 Tax=Nocardioides sp. Kera G14 TaxID=2884264 RepID=UPI001D10EF70|nr:histidine phosphatase family protein [Nocardioides sp. Kera G14]UDY24770.1 histidine phosphatase family protein [Nocardioides sp. Kera G14]